MNSSNHADVLIVGAGAAGGVAALRLVEAGLNVVALEQGEWQDRANYRGSEWDWELAAGAGFSALPSLRKSPFDYPIDTEESDMLQYNFCGVGGSTILYNGIWIRFMEEHFRTKSLCGQGEDWPISYQDLQSFYERTDVQVGVSGLGGNPAYPPGAEPPLPPFPIGEAGMAVARALAKRGWHWWPDTNAILSTPYDGRYGCVQRGTCPSGCNEGAKSSFDLTHWSKVKAKGGSLVTGARVTRIVVDSKGLAAGAEWVDDAGRMQFQSADIVLVACNGIGTPRLLLNSGNQQFPDGLANKSGLLGRGLMLHPLSIVSGLFEQQFSAWQGYNGSMLQSLQHANHDSDRGFSLGAKWALHPSGVGPIALGRMLMERGDNPDNHHRLFAERFGHTLNWSIMCEDIRRDSNRVILSSELQDSSGMPAPKVIYRYDENSRKNLDFNVERASEVFYEAGAHTVEVRNPSGANAHFMGTARMGLEPELSVVDSWCMTHDVPNLGIIDGSVFVSSAPVNPTSTICALALRTAEYILENRAKLPVPSKSIHIALSHTVPVRAVQVREPSTLMTQVQWSVLECYGDWLIPASEIMPSAGSVLKDEVQQQRVLASRPDLGDLLGRALVGKIGEPDLELPALAIEDPQAHQALLLFVSACYYTHPEVKRLIGYDGQVAAPVMPDKYPVYFEEGLLDHLISDE